MCAENDRRLGKYVTTLWYLCRMRHRRHYAASRTMPRVDARALIDARLNRVEAA
jgi:hypothetical protein